MGKKATAGLLWGHCVQHPSAGASPARAFVRRQAMSMNDTPNSNEQFQERLALPTDERFAKLMDQARRGSQEAAEEVWREYGPYVVYVVRRWLRPEMRGRLDSQDFAQDVWASFFREVPARDAVTSPDDLIRLLTKMAKNKVISEYRRHSNHRRDFEREESHGVFVDGQEIIDEREPTPSQVFAANALVDELTSGQTETCARMVQMRCDGLSDEEIADHEHVSIRSVRRVFDKLRSVFHRRRREQRE